MSKTVNNSVKNNDGDDSKPWRVMISLPAELLPFVESRVRQPIHAGKLTNYIRALVVQDQERELTT